MQLLRLMRDPSERVRQTVVYTAGEIAVRDVTTVRKILELGLYDNHHSVRNAVIGALKNAGNKNEEAHAFCAAYMLSDSAEVRRLVCHGLELCGRTHPQEIIETLKLLQFDDNRRVRAMLIHVLGQISYKKGCFVFVAQAVSKWENKEIYELFQAETIEVHGRYEKFSALTQSEVVAYFAERA